MQLIQNGPVRRTLQRQAAQRARRYSASAMSDTHRDLYQGMVPEIATSPSPRRIPPEARP
jgi:hypothetical protein